MHCLTTQDCTSLPPALLTHAITCLGCNFTLIEASFSTGPCVSHQHIKRAVITRPHGGVPAHLPAFSQEALRCVLFLAAFLFACGSCPCCQLRLNSLHPPSCVPAVWPPAARQPHRHWLDGAHKAPRAAGAWVGYPQLLRLLSCQLQSNRPKTCTAYQCHRALGRWNVPSLQQ